MSLIYGDTEWRGLALSAQQSRFGDEPLGIRLVCTQIGTAAQNG